MSPEKRKQNPKPAQAKLSEVVASAEIPPTPHAHPHKSPQPRAWGLLLSLAVLPICALGTYGVASVAQEARLRYAARLLNQAADPSSPTCSPNLGTLSKAIDSIEHSESSLSAWKFLHAETSDSGAAAALERSLLTRLALLEDWKNMPRDSQPNLKRAARVGLLAPLSVKSSSDSEDSPAQKASLLQSELSEALEASDQNVKELSEYHDRAMSFVQRAALIRSEAMRIFHLRGQLETGAAIEDEEPSAAENSEDQAVSMQLYQDGLLKGVPVLTDVPDNLANPESLKTAIVSAGGSVSVSAEENLEEVRATMTALRRSAESLLQDQLTLAADRERLQNEKEQHLARLKDLRLNLCKNYVQILRKSLLGADRDAALRS